MENVNSLQIDMVLRRPQVAVESYLVCYVTRRDVLCSSVGSVTKDIQRDTDLYFLSDILSPPAGAFLQKIHCPLLPALSGTSSLFYHTSFPWSSDSVCLIQCKKVRLRGSHE